MRTALTDKSGWPRRRNRGWRIRLAILSFAAGAMLVGPASAAPGSKATDASIAAINCNQYSGGGIAPRSAQYIIGDTTGAVQLCKSGSNYWGYVVFDSLVSGPYWGQAYLYQYRNGTLIHSASCDTAPQGSPSGGNGWVRPGQTQCWTHKFDGSNAGDTFKACGAEYFGQYPDRTFIVGDACTARVR
jgi:hypothetical protein